MPLLLHGRSADDESCAPIGRWLLVGGPGSGKSTLTRMLAQQLRVAWIEGRRAVLPTKLGDEWQAMHSALTTLAVDLDWQPPREVLPLRIDLPSLARWMAGRDPKQLTLWDYLAHRIVEDLAGWDIAVDLTGSALRAIAEVARITWILDGLDEVPTTAGRAEMIDLVRATVCSDERETDRVVVSTRPQGYGREFDDLDELELDSLPSEAASYYAERLLRAWYRSSPSVLGERLERLHAEVAKAEVAELLHTPLHTTMAAVLIANRGSLPVARSRLFEHYFHMIWRRELDKPFERSVEDQDEPIVRALHRRAGLILHVRSQAAEGARATLRRHELRQMLTALFVEFGYDEDGARNHVDRLMRFAAERLVLLLHAAQGEYEFGVRSLQEFFAAGALLDGELAMVRTRLEAVVLNSHWSNVLAFVISEAALRTNATGREAALAATVGLCRALNDGVIGGQAAVRCAMGSRLAMHMLAETEHYGHPWLHDPLWEIALEAASAPIQRNIADIQKLALQSRASWTDATELHTRLGALAGSWSKIQATAVSQRVLAFAQQALSAGEADRGWRLLHGLLSARMPEAIELANRNAPQTREEARELVGLLLHDELTATPAWVSEYVDRYPEFFLLFRSDSDGIVFRLSELFNMPTTIRVGLHEHHIPLDALPPTDYEDPSPQIPDGPGWTRWRQVAAFLSSPSHLELADLLDSIDDDESYADFSHISWHFPWPLAVCLWAARSRDELASFAAMLRRGELGTLDDWLAAETRWTANSNLSIDDALAWLHARGPWNHDIANRGAPLVIPGRQSDVDALLDQLDLTNDLSPNVDRFLAATYRFVVPPRVAKLALQSHAGWWMPSIGSICAGLASGERDDWFELLDRAGREQPNRKFWYGAPALYWDTIWVSLCERLSSRPDQWGLIVVLSNILMRALSDGIDPSKHKPPDLPPSLPENAPHHALAARALLCFVADSDRIDTSKVPELIEQLGDRVQDLARFLRSRADTDTAIELLLGALDRTSDPVYSDELLADLYGFLRDTQPPAFDRSEVWTLHALPEPYLGLAPFPPTPPRLRRITELTNLRLFKATPTVDVPFPTPPADRGQWIVLVGENGVGKTTLLRALALALASSPVASKLLDERLPMIRSGAEARIAIELDSGLIAVTVSRQGRTEQVESYAPDTHRPWVVGYGVRRGNARGESDRDAEVGALGELHTLFDRPASLHNAAQWIAELDADVLREQRNSERDGKASTRPGPREQIWRSVQRALEGLLGITKIEVAEGGMVFVDHPDFGRVRLEALSDGYLTTAGWVIDMIARWVDRQYELDEPIGPQVLHQMCGFVLIDEIDLHLHPRWQLRILENIRQQFPRLSFVVTTHNPLTLQGARRGEVYIMRRDGESIELVQRDIRPGHDVDRVLLEQFGLEHTFDSETRKVLARHRNLVEAGVARDDPERAKLETQLRERFGEVGETIGHEREINHGIGGPLTAEERERFLVDYATNDDGEV